MATLVERLEMENSHLIRSIQVALMTTASKWLA